MKIVSCILLVTFSLSAFAQQGKPIVFGQSYQLQSAALKEKRTINVYLPEDYNPKDTVKYPVIYIIDGGVEEDFIHVAGLVRYNTQPWIARFPRSIVVGIENTNRRRDCTFAVDNLNFLDKIGFKKENFPAYGGSANYISFLEKELQPWISRRFRTNGDRTLIGESLAGLLSTEILLKHRDLFNSYIIMSPSLWWGNESLLAEAPALLQNAGGRPVSVYLGVCSKDEDKVMYDDAVALRDVLQKHGGSNTKVYYDYLPDEIHSTIMHQAVYNAFKLIYPKTALQK